MTYNPYLYIRMHPDLLEDFQALMDNYGVDIAAQGTITELDPFSGNHITANVWAALDSDDDEVMAKGFGWE